ncbi:hypothetical protein BH11MYX1_BH11MYX1_49950 [soil metagenome]
MRIVAGFLMGAVLTAGCGPSWPSGTLNARAPHPDHAVTSVDILPLDLELWSEAGFVTNPEQLRGEAEASITNAALDQLVKHQYSPSAMIDWNGSFADGQQALDKQALLSTVGALAHYGIAAPVKPGAQLPIPWLPARLGETTGADATLYIGGWSYVAAPRESTGSTVAKDLAIGLLVVATIAVAVIAIAAISGHYKHHAASHSHDHAGDASPDASQMSGGVAVTRWRGHGESGAHAFARASTDLVANIAINSLDAWGRIATEAELHPEYAEDPQLPHGGEDSKLYLQMTLVDNHTGLALWHAHQTFPASGASQDDVSRAARQLLDSMPAS